MPPTPQDPLHIEPRQAGRRAPDAHALNGADLGTLWRVQSSAGRLPAKSRLRLLGFAAAAMGRLPFTVTEELSARRRLRREGPPVAPVFILGHWRSGTTHLYNLLAQSPRFAWVPPVAVGLPWEMMTLGRWLRPLLEKALPESRYIDNVPVTPNAPQEDEIALANMCSLSFYHGIYFPNRLREAFEAGVFLDGVDHGARAAWERRFLTFLAKLAWQQPGRTLVIKNPVYTARVAHLRALFPKARFIHIHRDPYRVFASTQHFYDRLLAQFALQERPPQSVIDALILDGYERMMDRLLADTATLPGERFAEIGYGALEKEPLTCLAHLYAQLELGDFSADEPLFRAYLEGISGYQKNRFSPAQAADPRVAQRWKRFLDHWGYARRDDAA